MAEENDKTIDIKDEDVRHVDLTSEQIADDSIDWKAKALELQGIAKRRATQLMKAKEKLEKLAGAQPKDLNVPPQDKSNSKPNELDYAQKAYLIAKGIQENEFEFVQQIMLETGRTLESVMAGKFFQAELNERRKAEKLNNAIPNIPGRTNSEPASNKVEYWLQKGEMPPNTPENYQLRREYVNRKYEISKKAGQFSGNPIING